MEFMLDSANLEKIEFYNRHYPIAGVTTNPSILKAEGKVDFFAHMREIRSIIGKEKSLHIQVVAGGHDQIIREAGAILKNVDDKVFIKIPTNEEGIHAMQRLKMDGVNITATGVYTRMQGFLAIAAGADYIAPYFNRMANLDIDPVETISALAHIIAAHNSGAKVVAASFKNIAQVNDALLAGAHAATLAPDILGSVFDMPSIQLAIDGFHKDWAAVQGDVSIADL